MPHRVSEEFDVDTVRLGPTGLRVGRLALGTVNFGGRTDESEAHRVIDAAVANGVDLIDTANNYGWRVHRGFTEELIGRWLAADPGRRQRIVLATKVGQQMGDGANDRGLSASHIVSACEASLKRLGTDHIDLYQMHVHDPATPWEVVWQAMDTLIAQGKVRYVGSSNFAGWNLVDAQRVAQRQGMVGLVTEQCAYNLVTRYPELEILPAAQASGLTVLAWAPLHGGLLSGALQKRAAGTAVKSAQGRAETSLPLHRDAVEKFEQWCAETDRVPATVALAWLLCRPGPIVPVVGPRTVGQLESAVRTVHHELTPEDLDHLERLFPPIGYGGPAPGAWVD